MFSVTSQLQVLLHTVVNCLCNSSARLRVQTNTLPLPDLTVATPFLELALVCFSFLEII